MENNKEFVPTKEQKELAQTLFPQICQTLIVYGLSKCHPNSCDECPNKNP